MSKHDPTHPDESIRDAMQDVGMSATEMAAALGMERGNLYRINTPSMIDRFHSCMKTYC